jgi:hypothetical protein
MACCWQCTDILYHNINNLQMILQNNIIVCICSKYYGLLKDSTKSINTFHPKDTKHPNSTGVMLYHDLQCESHQLPRKAWIRITQDIISNSKSNSSSSDIWRCNNLIALLPVRQLLLWRIKKWDAALALPSLWLQKDIGLHTLEFTALLTSVQIHWPNASNVIKKLTLQDCGMWCSVVGRMAPNILKKQSIFISSGQAVQEESTTFLQNTTNYSPNNKV